MLKASSPIRPFVHPWHVRQTRNKWLGEDCRSEKGGVAVREWPRPGEPISSVAGRRSRRNPVVVHAIAKTRNSAATAHRDSTRLEGRSVRAVVSGGGGNPWLRVESQRRVGVVQVAVMVRVSGFPFVAQEPQTMLRFHLPLIEPDGGFSASGLPTRHPAYAHREARRRAEMPNRSPSTSSYRC